MLEVISFSSTVPDIALQRKSLTSSSNCFTASGVTFLDDIGVGTLWAAITHNMFLLVKIIFIVFIFRNFQNDVISVSRLEVCNHCGPPRELPTVVRERTPWTRGRAHIREGFIDWHGRSCFSSVGSQIRVWCFLTLSRVAARRGSFGSVTWCHLDRSRDSSSPVWRSLDPRGALDKAYP